MIIGVIGFNIFSPGGTTRSNINLIKEFSSINYSVKYFNYFDFSNKDISKLILNNEIKGNASFFRFKDIFKEKLDLLIITREDFFSVAKIIKSIMPNCKVVGEIHSPLSLIEEDIRGSLEYLDCVRVSTESIKQKFIENYNYNRVFAHTVSLNHLKDLKYSRDIKTNNLLIYSRFDESSKDITYAIKVIAYIVNELKYNKVKLFINGYGSDEIIYKRLITDYKLENNIFLNSIFPENYIYLSTSKFETFGYSIIEAIIKGHRVILYEGEDKVLREVYKDFKMVRWIEKQIEKDSLNIIKYLNEGNNDKNYRCDRNRVLSFNKDYASKYMGFIEQYTQKSEMKEVEILDKKQINIIYKSILSKRQSDNIIRRVYSKVKRILMLKDIFKRDKQKYGY